MHIQLHSQLTTRLTEIAFFVIHSIPTDVNTLAADGDNNWWSILEILKGDIKFV